MVVACGGGVLVECRLFQLLMDKQQYTYLHAMGPGRRCQQTLGGHCLLPIVCCQCFRNAGVVPRKYFCYREPKAFRARPRDPGTMAHPFLH